MEPRLEFNNREARHTIIGKIRNDIQQVIGPFVITGFQLYTT